MGLPEKRALKEFQESQFPGLKTAIEQVAGFPVEIDVKWDSMTEDGTAHLVNDAFLKVYFQPVIDGLKKICVDDMGKEALQASLNKIVLHNTDEYSNPKGISFENGVLAVNHKPFTNMEDVAERTKQVVALLEANL